MKAISVRFAWYLFVGAILVLAVIAFVADRAEQQYASSEAWVSHTREVEAQIAALRAVVAMASSAPYQTAADPTAAVRYRQASGSVPGLVNELQFLTNDNPVQQTNVNRLRSAVTQELQAIAAGMSSPLALSPASRAAAADSTQDAANTNGILDAMRSEEESLLTTRTAVSAQRYRNLRIILGLGLLCVLGVLIFAFRTLLSQLSQRMAAEHSVRRLSAHILRVQDGERRRLARELHDGLGQIFAGLNMELGSLARRLELDGDHKESLASAQQMTSEGLAQTRTISYLLHPPMLDDFGFEQAAKWYVEGFSSRSRIDVKLVITQPFKRMPEAMELVLFRVIQEALTNVHRHSESSRAEIVATQHPDRVGLMIRDFGTGIPADLLQSIEEGSAGAGIGLGGMRERVAEMGGHLTIESAPDGTTLTVSLPYHPVEEESHAAGGPRMGAAAARNRHAKAAR